MSKLKEFFYLLKWIGNELKFTKIEIIFICIFNLLSKLPILITPWCIGKIFDGIILRNINFIAKYILIISLIFIFVTIVNYVFNRIIINTKLKKFSLISENTIKTILSKEVEDIKKIELTKIINLLNSDILSISDFLFEFIELSINLLISTVAVFIMLNINMTLSLIALVYFFFGIVRFIKIGDKYRLSENDLKLIYDKYLAFNLDSINGFLDLKIINGINRRIEDFKKINEKLIFFHKKRNLLDINNNVIISFLSFIFTIVSLLVGARLIFLNVLSIGMLVAFYDYQNNFQGTITNFGGLYTFVQQTYVLKNRYESINFFKHNDKYFDFVDYTGKFNKLQIDQLTVFDNEKNTLIKNFNYIFKPGKIYMIQGKNGSGKTTLLNVITGLNKNYSGTILYNDQDIKSIESNLLFNHIGYILQNNHIFSSSIKYNILLGRKYTDQFLLNSMEKFNLSRDIYKLDKNISEYDHGLSGGEIKKIAILRILIFNYDIYLLDEIFNGVDYNTKKEIYKFINELAKEKIIICIDHNTINFDSLNIKVEKVNIA